MVTMAMRLTCSAYTVRQLLCGTTVTPRLCASCFQLKRQSSHPAKATLAETFVKTVPKSLRPYLRLARIDRPIGTWLLFIPSSWGIAFAAEAGHLPDLKMIALFGAGALLMRGAGCTVNDLVDRDFDKCVERTRSRPLPAGELTPLHALLFLGGQLSLSLCILLQLNWYSVALGAASLPLVFSYPLFKRITFWPQAVLGLTFNWGTLLGYSAVAGVCDWSVCLPAYAAAFNWTIIYDTIYAHQDKEDDILIGVKSTALLFKEKTKAWLYSFSVPMALGLTMAGVNGGMSHIYFAGVATTMGLILRQIHSVNLDSPSDCLKHFKANRNIGLMFLGFIVCDKLFLG